MTESHPRRFVLALSVAKDDLVRVYLYTCSRLPSCELGSPPSVPTNEAWSNSVKDVIKFLILLYSELPSTVTGLPPPQTDPLDLDPFQLLSNISMVDKFSLDM
ncbi:hypothetical protein H4S02_001746 [Coemansia sp. RSA 2611]|nr:hypothetical protein H4S02_001746 [Coemansia sp. RSA 2611]